MAACFVGVYLAGILLAHLPHEFFAMGLLFNTHKMLGLLVLGLLLARMFTVLQAFSRKYLKRKPALTQDWLKTFAFHLLLYVLMLMIPITGILMISRGGQEGVLPFVALPDWISQNRSLLHLAHSLHFWFAYMLLGLIGLHLVEQRRFLQRVWERFLKTYFSKA
jgi:cytochrome b561